MKNRICKKKIVTFIFILFTLFIISPLSGCGIEELNIEKMELMEGCPSDFVIGCFNYNDYKFIVTYNDGSSKEVTLDKEMLSNEDYLKTFKQGTYTFTAKYLNVSCEFEVNAKAYEFSNIYFKNAVYTYDGLPHSLSLEGAIPEGTVVTYVRGESFVNAGTYEITAILSNDYYVSTSVKGYLTINKADYDMSGITFDDVTYQYDGTPKTINVNGIVDNNLKVTYSINGTSTNSMINAGNYKVIAHFEPGGNYNSIPDQEATLIINKGDYDLSKCKLLSKTYTYDGLSHSLSLSNLSSLPSGITVLYDNNNQTKAGQYEVVASFIGDANNYNPIPSLKATLTILKATISLNQVYLDNDSFTYDGSPKYVYYDGKLPSGVTFINYEYYECDEDGNNLQKVDAMIDVGYYTVKALFNYKDKTNYEEIEPLTCLVKIDKADITTAIFSDSFEKYDGYSHSLYVENLPDGVKVDYTNNAQTEVGTYKIKATFSFVSGSKAERNYNSLSPKTATLTISKAEIGEELEDISVDYSGETYSLKIENIKDDKDNVIGQKTLLMNGSEEIEEKDFSEILPDGISVYYCITDSNNNEIAFTGISTPTSAVISAHYYALNYSDALFCSTHYNTNEPTLKTYYIDNTYKQVYHLYTKYFTFSVKKLTYIPSFMNQLSSYTGSPITVTIDTAKDLADTSRYPNLSFEAGYETTGGLYSDNTQTKTGFYTGSVEIKLSEEALNYYYNPEKYTFNYCIREKSGQVTFNPGISNVMEKTYDETISTYTLSCDTELPKGLNIDFSYDETITKPGTYFVTIKVYFDNDNDPNVVSFGDMAAYYYKLPSSFKQGYDNVYTRIVTFIVNKKMYTPSFITDYYYDSNPIAILGDNIPTWIDCVYYENGTIVSSETNPSVGHNILIPGTYHIKAMPTIIDSEKDIYYQVNTEGIEFDIEVHKGKFTNYSLIGQTVKYDGEYHKVEVVGLPEGITCSTYPTNGYKDVGVYKNFIIYFNNQNPYYENLNNLKVTLTIENNYVEKGNIQAYCKSTDRKSIPQFYSMREILSKYVDLTGATLEWTVDYYHENNEIYQSSYTSRHGSSDTSDDFIFTEETLENEYVILNFKITLNTGYLFNDLKESTEFSGTLTLVVEEATKIDVNRFKDITDGNAININQNTKLIDLFNAYLPEEILNYYQVKSWSVDYYDGLSIYPSSYNLSHSGMTDETNDFVFMLNTWGERYALVKYELTLDRSYCFYNEDTSSMSFSSTFRCYVDKVVTCVDDYFLQTSISEGTLLVDQYTYVEDYIGTLIDLNCVNVNLKIKDANGDEIKGDSNNKHFIDQANHYYVDLTISLKSGVNSFMNTLDKTISYSHLILTVKKNSIVNLKDKLSQKANDSLTNPIQLEEYQDPISLLSDIDATTLNKVIYSYTVTYVYLNDSEEEVTKSYLGLADSPISLPYFKNTKSVLIDWTFVAKEGYCFVEDGSSGVKVNSVHFIFNVTIKDMTVIHPADLMDFTIDPILVNQYTTVNDAISEEMNQFESLLSKENPKNYYTFDWSGAYYNGENALNKGLVVNNKSDDFNAIFDLDTTDGSYFYMVLQLHFNDDSGFVFNDHTKTLSLALAFNVHPIEPFEEEKVKTLNNSVLSYPVSTSLQQVLNDFALHDNLNVTNYSINSKVENQAYSKIYIFDSVDNYEITLTLQTKEDTCILEEGLGITTFKLNIMVSTYISYFSKLLLSDTSYQLTSDSQNNKLIIINNQDEYCRLTSYESFMKQYLDNLNAFEEISCSDDNTNYVAYDETKQFETAGNFTYTFKLQVRKTTSMDHYYLFLDLNEETLSRNVDEDDNGLIYLQITFEIYDFSVASLDTTTDNPYGSSYNDIINGNSTLYVTDRPLTDYVLYTISDYCTLSSCSLIQNGSSRSLDETDYSDNTLFSKLSLQVFSLDYKIVCKKGYAFDEFGNQELSFSLDLTYVDSSKILSLDDFKTNYVSSSDTVLLHQFELANKLVAYDSSKTMFAYPLADTYTITYDFYRFDTNEGYYDSFSLQAKSDVANVDTYLNQNINYVYRVDYHILKSGYYFSNEFNPWIYLDYHGFYYIYPTKVYENTNAHLWASTVESEYKFIRKDVGLTGCLFVNQGDSTRKVMEEFTIYPNTTYIDEHASFPIAFTVYNNGSSALKKKHSSIQVYNFVGPSQVNNVTYNHFNQRISGSALFTNTTNLNGAYFLDCYDNRYYYAYDVMVVDN